MNSYLFSLLNIFMIIMFVEAQSQFVDVHKSSKIIHAHISSNLLGGGIGIIDINNDGLEDLFLTGGTSHDKLYLNLGDLNFEDISVNSGIENATRLIKTTSVTIIDFNNDSFEDIYISTDQGSSPMILINNKNNTFQDISLSAFDNKYDAWGTGATIIDANHDGLLDIYQVNYIKEYGSTINEAGEIIGFRHKCYPNYLFINDGNLTFTESAQEYQLASIGCGLAAMTTDLNEDMHADLLIANDFGEWVVPNEAYVFNESTGKYNEIAHELGLNDSIYAMGITSLDLDRNLFPELYITNIGSNLLKSPSNNYYIDIAENVGVQNELSGKTQTTSWGTLGIDFNNDSYDDLYVANGYIGAALFLNVSEYDTNRFYLNNQNGKLIDITLDQPINNVSSKGAAYCDINNDGRIDIVGSNVEKIRYHANSNTNVLINQFETNNNWISILVDTTIASTISELIIRHENISQRKLITFGGSHASSNSRRIHFGIGNSQIISELIYKYSNKDSIVFNDIEANNQILISHSSKSFTYLSCEKNQWGCDLEVEQPLNIIDLNYAIYPNVTTGLIYSSVHNGESYHLYDLNGSLIEKGIIKNEKIDFSKNKKGMYLLQIDQQTFKILLVN